MPPRRRIVAAAAVLAAVALLGPAGAHGAVPDTASRVPVTISVLTLDGGTLTYRGKADVPTSAGPVTTLEFGVDASAYHGLDLALPCVAIPLGGLTGHTATAGTATAAQLTVFAVDVTATINGAATRFTSTGSDYPPPADGTVLAVDGDLTLIAVLATSSSLHVGPSGSTAPGLTTSATFCHPTAAKPLTGSPLAAMPTPSTPTPGATQPAGGTEPSAPSTTSSGPSTPPKDTSSPSPSPSPPPSPTAQPSGDTTAPSAPEPSPALAPEPSPTP